MNGLQETSIIQTVKVMKNKEGLRNSQARIQGDMTMNSEGVSVGGGTILEQEKGHLW